ncbi:MAG: PhzF family phenazine biosynthesis protein [Calditrichia bacterium]
MKIPIYQIDAFTDRLFSGNPAAVCPLEEWPEDELLQSIAAENNLSETAFFIPNNNEYDLRWFTPATEVDLCGHATLATAHLIMNILEPERQAAVFNTKSGKLEVTKSGNSLVMRFPVYKPVKCEAPELLIRGLRHPPVEVYCARDYVAVYETEGEVKALQPDFEILKRLDLSGVMATAPGKESDFVSRFFAPKEGINEDPVTGSAHCTLAPFWAKRLGKASLSARQISARGGELSCEIQGEQLLIRGKAVLFLEGTLMI